MEGIGIGIAAQNSSTLLLWGLRMLGLRSGLITRCFQRLMAGKGRGSFLRRDLLIQGHIAHCVSLCLRFVFSRSYTPLALVPTSLPHLAIVH